MPDQTTWIKDGTEDAEPETTETPAVETVDAAAEVVEGATATADESAAGDEGTGAAEAETVEEVAQKFIEAKLGEEAFQLPEGVLVPQTRGGKVEYVPIDEVLKRGMSGNDYRIKTTELAQGRRTLDRNTEDLTAREARMDARAKYMDERESEMKSALTDPKSAAAYQEHLAQYQTNPMYRKNVDAALLQQETEAERDALQQREDGRVVQEASREVFSWIDDLKVEYASVDPERVRQIYGRQLSSGAAPLDRSAVESVFKEEQEYVNKTVSPLRDELAGIKAQLESLQASKTADQQNKTTQHAVTRAKTVPVATGAGAPAKAYVPPEKFGPNELAERNSAWAKAG